MRRQNVERTLREIPRKIDITIAGKSDESLCVKFIQVFQIIFLGIREMFTNVVEETVSPFPYCGV